MKLLKDKPLTIALIALQFFYLASAHANVPEKVWQTSRFEEPESALFDPDKKVFYVSNIKGSPIAKDGQGYISRLSEKGKITDLHWVNDLNAPKGLAINGGKLYVADMQQLHIINTHSGHLEKSIDVPTSKMLNDVAIDSKGNVYITDILGGGIFQYKDEQMTQWISPLKLPHPNGLFIKGKTLFVATWGKGMKDDFSTTELGSLYQVDLNNKAISLIKDAQHIGNLDGITSINQQLIVNDWMNGNIFRRDKNGTKLLFKVAKSASDISSDGNYLIVPVMKENTVIAYNISKIQEHGNK